MGASIGEIRGRDTNDEPSSERYRWNWHGEYTYVEIIVPLFCRDTVKRLADSYGDARDNVADKPNWIFGVNTRGRSEIDFKQGSPSIVILRRFIRPPISFENNNFAKNKFGNVVSNNRRFDKVELNLRIRDCDLCRCFYTMVIFTTNAILI